MPEFIHVLNEHKIEVPKAGSSISASVKGKVSKVANWLGTKYGVSSNEPDVTKPVVGSLKVKFISLPEGTINSFLEGKTSGKEHWLTAELDHPKRLSKFLHTVTKLLDKNVAFKIIPPQNDESAHVLEVACDDYMLSRKHVQALASHFEKVESL